MWAASIRGRILNDGPEGFATLKIGIERPRAAIVTIDLHRGHLDPVSTTMPASPKVAALYVENNRRLLDTARPFSIPVIHCVTTYRDVEEIRPPIRSGAPGPRIRMRRERTCSVIISPDRGAAPSSGTPHPTDFVVDTKKRYDCFQGTDLDTALRTHGINTLLVTA